MATDESGRECYAKALGDCAGKLSREHYVSNNILEAMQDEGAITVSGLAMIGDGAAKQLRAASLTAKFLCEKHNGELSPVDTAGGQYLLELFNGHKALQDNSLSADRVVTIDGLLVERWLLKVACGIISSGNAAVAEGKLAKTPPPLGLLQILFGQRPLADPKGLHVTPQEVNGSRGKIRFQLLNTYRTMAGKENERQLTGIEMIHYGLGSLLRLAEDFPPTEGIDFSKAVYRPDYLEVIRESTGRKVRIELTWPTGLTGKGLTMKVLELGSGSTKTNAADSQVGKGA